MLHDYILINSGEADLHQGALVPSVSVDRLLAHRENALNLARDGLAQLRRAVDEVKGGMQASEWQMSFAAALLGHSYMSDDGDWDSEALERFRATLDAQNWQNLLLASGLRTFMDAKSRAEWDEHVHKTTTPPFTAENVAATFTKIYDERGLMVGRGVIELFRGLSWNYKSNLPVRFGSKLVAERVLNCDRGRWYTYSRSGKYEIDDLLRMTCFLDGKPEPDIRNSPSNWLTKEDLAGAPWEPYWELKRFKNGNIHIRFLRDDLVDRLNQILAKHYPGALPAPR